MLKLFESQLIPAAQWEYDAVNIDLVDTHWTHKLQFLLASEASYQHGQTLTETQVQEIKARHTEVWQEVLDGVLPEEIPMPHFIVGSGTEEDPYKMSYSSFLLTEE